MKKSCSCAQCVALCQRCPGWFTPDEAAQAIAAGHARKLMRDWLEPCDEVGNAERIYVLCPATLGREGQDAPEFSTLALLFSFGGGLKKGVCTFLHAGLCSIHASGYKPRQCREAYGCSSKNHGPDNYEMARLWQTPEGLATLAQWAGQI